MLLIVSTAVPVLVMVTVCEPLEVPTFVVLYSILVADRVTGGSTPVPLKVIDCGEVPAVSVITRVAFSAPPFVGAKCPWMLQLAPAAKLIPQLFANTYDSAFAPATAMLVIVKGADPSLVIVTYCDALVEPTVTVPNERLVDVRPTWTATPVPLSEMVCGELAALSVIVTAALNEPACVGAKCPCIEQFALAAKLVPQLLANTQEDALVPVSVMLPIDTAELPVLVSVTYCELPVEPTFNEPNDKFVADKLTVPAEGIENPSAFRIVISDLPSFRIVRPPSSPAQPSAS